MDNNYNNMETNNMTNEQVMVQPPAPKKSKAPILIVIILLIALLVGGAYYLGTQHQSDSKKTNTEQQEPQEEKDPKEEIEPTKEETKKEEQKEAKPAKNPCEDAKYIEAKELSIKLNGNNHTLRECYRIEDNADTPDGEGYMLYKDIYLDDKIVEKDIEDSYDLENKNELTKIAKEATVEKNSPSILKDTKNGKEYYLHEYTSDYGFASPTVLIIISESGKNLAEIHVSDLTDVAVTFDNSNKGDRNLDEYMQYMNLDIHDNFIYVLEADEDEGDCETANEYKVTIENGEVKTKLINTYTGENVMIAGQC